MPALVCTSRRSRSIASLEGADGDNDVVRVGPAVGDRPQQGREEERAVAVDDEDADVRPTAQPLVQPQRHRHPAEAGAKDQDLMPRGVVGEDRLGLVPVPPCGAPDPPAGEGERTSNRKRARCRTAPPTAHPRLLHVRPSQTTPPRRGDDMHTPCSPTDRLAAGSRSTRRRSGAGPCK
ncbi:MAG: hypothetical protein M3Q71_21265, partial [Chloroflexota bacterium]|nr:hypothetical protein [Chloroflexota bacterium]